MFFFQQKNRHVICYVPFTHASSTYYVLSIRTLDSTVNSWRNTKRKRKQTNIHILNSTYIRLVHVVTPMVWTPDLSMAYI